MFPDMSTSHITPSQTGRTLPVLIPRKPRSISPYAPLSAPASLSSLTGPEDGWETESDTDDEDDDSGFESNLESDLNADVSEKDEDEEDDDFDVSGLYLVPTPAVAHRRSQPVDIPAGPKRESTPVQTPFGSSRSFGGMSFASDPCGNVRGRDGVWIAPDGGVVPGKPDQVRSMERCRERIMREVVC